MQVSRLSSQCPERDHMAAHASLIDFRQRESRQHVAVFREDLAGCVKYYAGLWTGTPCNLPTPGLAFTLEEQRRNEREMGRLIGLIEKKLSDCPDDAFKREAWRERLLHEVQKVAGERLGGRLRRGGLPGTGHLWNGYPAGQLVWHHLHDHGICIVHSRY